MGIARKAPVRGLVQGVGVAAAVVGLVAGCSSSVNGDPQETVNGSPTREQTAQYNPCTELSDDAVRAAGVDPATKRTVTDAPTGDTAGRICQWKSTEGSFFVGVGSLVYSQDDARRNDRVVQVDETTVGSRHALIYRDKGDPDMLSCYVNIPWQKGTFEVSVGWMYSQRSSMQQAQPCDLAQERAVTLEPFLPS